MFNGTRTDNYIIAQALAQKFQSSGVTLLPAKGDSGLDDADAATNGEWEVTFVSPGGGDGGFVNRQKYLDALKVRGLGLPERAVLEGQFGTKAEAEAHADFAILNMELRHHFIVMTVNNHLVNRLLKFNYGEESENTVKIVPSPIGDAGKTFLRDVYKNIITNPEGALYEIERIDLNALREQIGIPKAPNDEEGPFSDNRVAMQNQPGIAAMLAAVAGGTMSVQVAKLLLVKTYGINPVDAQMMIETTKKLPKPAAPGPPM